MKILAIVASLGLTTFLSQGDRLLAQVAGERVTAGNFRQYLSTLQSRNDAGVTLKTLTPQGREEILDGLIQKRLFAAAARDAGLDRREDVRFRIEEAIADVLSREFLELRTGDLAIGIDEMRAFYDAHRADFRTGRRVRARHILLATESDAQSVRERLASGGDFVSLAAERSTDPVTSARGGDLGWIRRGTMVQAFEDALFSAMAGTPIVVHTSFGFHVVRVDEIDEGTLPPFDAVRDDVRRAVVERRIADLTSALKQQHGVTIDRAVLEELGR
jgi:peptidyl-prolyl cis-trans isomerase C